MGLDFDLEDVEDGSEQLDALYNVNFLLGDLHRIGWGHLA